VCRARPRGRSLAGGRYVSVVVLRGPDEAPGGLDCLCDHVVDEAVLVIDARFVELFLVFAVMQVRGDLSRGQPDNADLPFIDFLEDVLKSAVVLLQIVFLVA
jgi:hypothetical protein